MDREEPRAVDAYRETVVMQATGSRGGVGLEMLITAGSMNAKDPTGDVAGSSAPREYRVLQSR